MLHKTFRFEVIEEEEGKDGGTIEGLASVYGNLDESMEIVDAGAFTRTLKNRSHKVPLLWQHRTDTPIGLANLKDSPRGLTMKAELNSDVRQAQEARALARQGVLGGLSIGYDVVKDTWEKDVRHLKELKLYEVSMVTFPANLEAQIVAVKEDGNTSENTGEDTPCPPVLEVKIGRTLSASTRSKLESARDAIAELLDTADADSDSEKSTPTPDAAKENSSNVATSDPEYHSLVKMMREMRGEAYQLKGETNV